jgi:hypothetical protein
MEEAARLVGRRLIVLKASTDADIDAAFEAFIRQRAGAALHARSFLRHADG